jgi:hypothetical protein
MKLWIGFGSEYCPITGCSEHDNKSSISMKGTEISSVTKRPSTSQESFLHRVSVFQQKWLLIWVLYFVSNQSALRSSRSSVTTEAAWQNHRQSNCIVAMFKLLCTYCCIILSWRGKKGLDFHSSASDVICNFQDFPILRGPFNELQTNFPCVAFDAIAWS